MASLEYSNGKGNEKERTHSKEYWKYANFSLLWLSYWNEFVLVCFEKKNNDIHPNFRVWFFFFLFWLQTFSNLSQWDTLNRIILRGLAVRFHMYYSLLQLLWLQPLSVKSPSSLCVRLRCVILYTTHIFIYTCVLCIMYDFFACFFFRSVIIFWFYF